MALGVNNGTPTLVIRWIAQSKFPKQVPPLVLKLSPRDAHWFDGAQRAYLSSIKGISTSRSFAMHFAEVCRECCARLRMGKETSQLRMMAIAAGFALNHSLGQECFSPERHQALRIKVAGVKGPQPHRLFWSLACRFSRGAEDHASRYRAAGSRQTMSGPPNLATARSNVTTCPPFRAWRVSCLEPATPGLEGRQPPFV